jgi:hypothetical protein
MVAATPRDVIHIRLASFVIFLALAVCVLALVGRVALPAIVAAVVAVIAIVDVLFAVRRQRRLGSGPRSTG